MKKTACVTGRNGFLGLNPCEALLQGRLARGQGSTLCEASHRCGPLRGE